MRHKGCGGEIQVAVTITYRYPLTGLDGDSYEYGAGDGVLDDVIESSLCCDGCGYEVTTDEVEEEPK